MKFTLMKFKYEDLRVLLRSRTFLFIWLFVAIPLIGFISLRHSLNLSLWGDDWLLLWVSIYQYEGTIWNRYEISSYLHPDGPKILFLYLLYSSFGLNPLAYYIASMALRIFSAISIYFLARGISNSKMAGIVASAMFAVCYVGLESTNWVFNANTYVGIIFLSFFVFFFYQSRSERVFLFYIISLLFFTLALVFAPPRMYGIFIVTLGDLLWFLRKPSFKIFKKCFLRFLPLIVIYYLLKLMGVFGSSNDLPSRVLGGIELGKELLKQGRFDFLLYPIASVGNVIFPDKFWLLPDKLSKIWMFYSPLRIAISFFVIVTITISLISMYLKKGKFFYLALSFAFASWLLCLWYIHKLQSSTFNNPTIIGPTLVGGIFLIWIIWLYFRCRDTFSELADSFLFTAGWIIAFFIFTWFFKPYIISPSYERYLTLSSVGFSSFIGCLAVLFFYTIINYSKSSFLLKVLLSLPIVVMIVGIFSINLVCSNYYLKQQVEIRGVLPSTKIWNSFKSHIPNLVDYPVFYFTYDDYVVYYSNIDFGFPVRVSILYDIPDYKKWPKHVADFDKLVSIMEQGIDTGSERKFIELDNVYSFHLKGHELINTRSETIQRLKQILVKETDSNGNLIWKRKFTSEWELPDK